MYGIIRTILVEKHSADIETETDRFTVFNLGPGKSFQVFLRKAEDGVSGHFSFGHRSAEKPLLTLYLCNRGSVLTSPASWFTDAGGSTSSWSSCS